MADGGELARQRGVHGFTLLCFMCAFLARCSGRLCLDEHQSAWLLHRLGWRLLSLGMGPSVVQTRRLGDGSKAWRFLGTSGVATKSWQARHATHAPCFSGTPHHVRMLTSPFTTAAAADSGEDSFFYYQHFFQCPTTRAAYRDVPERRDCT